MFALRTFIFYGIFLSASTQLSSAAKVKHGFLKTRLAMSQPLSARDNVGSLQKGLDVMEILAAHPAGLTLTDTANKAGLTRAGARRFLLTLVATGYAIQNGRCFSLSPRLLSLARTWLEGASLSTYAEPFMRQVAASLNESCSIAVLSGEDVVYVARVPGPHVLERRAPSREQTARLVHVDGPGPAGGLRGTAASRVSRRGQYQAENNEKHH